MEFDGGARRGVSARAQGHRGLIFADGVEPDPGDTGLGELLPEDVGSLSHAIVAWAGELGESARTLGVVTLHGVWSEGGGGEGEEPHEPCAFDGLSDHALFAGGGTESLSAMDFAVGAHGAAEGLEVLPLDIDGAIGAGLGDSALRDDWSGSEAIESTHVKSPSWAVWPGCCPGDGGARGNLGFDRV